MLSRALAALIALAVLFGVAPASFAQDDSFLERQQMLSGGRKPKHPELFGFFGGDSSRSSVSYTTTYAPGTIVVNTAERRLYLVQENGKALRYGIGVGRVGFTWKGTHKVTAKKEWPTWTPPPEMRARQKGLPVQMAGGENNPLGARAMYLGSTLYRIHGSNDPDSIGEAESSGCFRMTNEDVKDLYERVAIGTTVIVQ
jgi:lipoprotein-anchoring transpeptidase ErfK/SrfK